MKLVILIGPSAVGKMTVGQELAKRTDLDLLHNHQTIDLVMETSGKYDFELIRLLRQQVVAYYADNNKYGLIITFRHNLESVESLHHIYELINTAYTHLDKYDNLEIYIVELHADLETRLERNKTENRLYYKRCKANIEESTAELLNAEEYGVYNSESDERLIKDFSTYILLADSVDVLKIDNTNKSAEEAAEMIKQLIEKNE